MINRPPPLNRDYNRDPNSRAIRGRGFINHGFALTLFVVLGGSFGFRAYLELVSLLRNGGYAV